MTGGEKKRVGTVFDRNREGALRRLALAACAALVACAALWPATGVRAQEDASGLEQRVKAAFLYKFAGYVDWPANAFARPDTPLTIAVMGAEPVANELAQAVAGRKHNDRPIVVKRLKPGEPLDGVHIVFAGKSESSNLKQLAQAAQSRSALLVTEAEGALAQGSVINFVVTDRKVRFDIALDSAEKSGLRLSSRLLAVAQQVRGTP